MIDQVPGLIREGNLFLKISFRGGGLFERGGLFDSGGLIDHLRYFISDNNNKQIIFHFLSVYLSKTCLVILNVGYRMFLHDRARGEAECEIMKENIL